MAAEPAPRALETSSAFMAIERERFHTYSLLTRNLHWLAAALVVLYSLLAPGADRLALWSLAGIVVINTLALHSRLFDRFPVEGRIWLETALDLVWITAVVAASGGAGSPLFFLYYMAIYAGPPAASRRRAYAKAGAATLLAAGVVYWLGRQSGAAGEGWGVAFEALVWPLTGLWLVAWFSAEAGSAGADLHHRMFVAAHTDALTGLPNLRYFASAAELRGKLGEPYTLIMIDVDDLKRVNDTFGHANGSELLRVVAEAIRSGARSGDDLCSRAGGDEFIVRLAGASGEGALSYCRRVRAYLAEHPLAIDGIIVPISVSMGVASFPEHGRTLSEVTERADQALYQSKREGRARDRVWAA